MSHVASWSSYVVGSSDSYTEFLDVGFLCCHHWTIGSGCVMSAERWWIRVEIIIPADVTSGVCIRVIVR